MGDSNKDLEDLAKSTTEDFYELLGVTFDSDAAAIKKAYRKASIRYHPDKNPDNKDAADRFIYLGWARDILMDEKLKGEYDRARTRRREKVLQDELMDGRRRKMKDDLERREREAEQARNIGNSNLKRKRAEDMSEAEKQQELIQRLAEDGKRRRMEAQERREKARKEEEEASFMDLEKSPEPQPRQSGDTAELDRSVKITFQRDGDMASWDKEIITQKFSKYGKIDSVVMGKDKKVRPSGSKHRTLIARAFIIYTRLDYAHAAVMDAKTDFPTLESVAWVNGEPDIKSPPSNTIPSAPTTPNKPYIGGTPLSTPKFSFSPKTPSLHEVTMMRLKQAEKKRLEEQIRKEDRAEEAAE